MTPLMLIWGGFSKKALPKDSVPVLQVAQEKGHALAHLSLEELWDSVIEGKEVSLMPTAAHYVNLPRPLPTSATASFWA
jgi:hypothetical protein